MIYFVQNSKKIIYMKKFIEKVQESFLPASCVKGKGCSFKIEPLLLQPLFMYHDNNLSTKYSNYNYQNCITAPRKLTFPKFLDGGGVAGGGGGRGQGRGGAGRGVVVGRGEQRRGWELQARPDGEGRGEHVRRRGGRLGQAGAVWRVGAEICTRLVHCTIGNVLSTKMGGVLKVPGKVIKVQLKVYKVHWKVSPQYNTLKV